MLNIENKLNELKDDYLSVQPSEKFSQDGWMELKQRLDPKLVFFQFYRGFVFAAMLMVILLGGSLSLVNAMARSLPGDTLYPAKRVSENMIAAISGNNQIKVDSRAREIIDLAKSEKDSKVLKNTVEEYKKIISETKIEATKSEKLKKDFKKRLKKQEEQFKQIEKNNKQNEDLKDAIDAAKQARKEKGEVEGIKKRLRNSD